MHKSREHADLPQLPVELVSHVLRHVEMRDRLGACSLVCRTWRAAAVAGTDSIGVQVDGWQYGGRAKSFVQWLHKHGAALTHLSLVNSEHKDPVLLDLPFAQLKQLHSLSIQGCVLQQQQQDSQHGCSTATVQQHSTGATASSSSSSGSRRQSLFGLSDLTALDLGSVTYSLSVGLNALPTLTGLQQLRLSNLKEIMPAGVEWDKCVEDEAKYVCTRYFVPSCISSLTQLTKLELSPDLAPSCREEGPLTCLQQLQELALLMGVDGEVVYELDWLPSCLTKLQLHCTCDEPLNSSYMPGLLYATALQHLDLHVRYEGGHEAGLEPDFLHSMQQLRVLSLRGPMSKNGLPVLIEAVPGLTRLESLVISAEGYWRPLYGDTGDVWSGDESEPDIEVLQRHAALVPQLQHLTRLEITWQGDSPPLLPGGCGQHLFAAGRQLPQLKQLVLAMHSTTWDSDSIWHEYLEEGYGAVMDRVAACFGPGDVGRLVQCCPALEQLCIAGLVQPLVDMSPLTALTALTSLCLGGEAVDDDVASSVLVQLTGLQSLAVHFAYKLTDTGLLALTALTRLTLLQTAGCGISYEVTKPADDGCLQLMKEPSMPDVCMQLLQRCSPTSGNDRKQQQQGGNPRYGSWLCREALC